MCNSLSSVSSPWVFYECGGFHLGNGQWKPDRPRTGQMALCSCLQRPMFAFELSSKNHTKKTVDKTPLLHTCAYAERTHTYVCIWGWLRGCGGGACILKGLVQCVRGPFRLLSSQTKLWWRGSLQQDMAAGGERAAAALQPYLPAGGGYLSHVVHSLGWPIPSTATTTIAHREGHIQPYLSCFATHSI